MLLPKEDLERLAIRYQEKADRACQAYQDTAIQRYQREWQNNEDIADALWMAANAAQDMESFRMLKAEVLKIAMKADEAIAEDSPRESLVSILNDLISYAVISCNYKRQGKMRRANDESDSDQFISR